MPYKSHAQRRLFHWLESQGKISPRKVHEYDVASKGKKLPERVKKAFGGEVYAKKDTHCPACDLPLDSAPVAMDAGEGCPRCGFGDAKDVPKRMAMGGEVTDGTEEPAYRGAVDKHLKMMGEGLRGAMKEMEPKRRYRPFDATPRPRETMEPTTYRAGGGSVFGTLVGGAFEGMGRGMQGNGDKPKEEEKESKDNVVGKAVELLKASGGAGAAPAAPAASAAGAGAAGAAAAAPPVPVLARGGRVTCAHCGEVNFVPNKARGGMMHDKDEYPRKKTAHVDDGKPKAGFAKALKGRR